MKLTYFPLMARGLPITLALEHNQCEYEGEVITFDAWPAKKASGDCPLGQLPILTTDDVGTIAQTSSILSYIGKKFNGEGKDLKEKVISDSLFGVAEDIWNELNFRQPSVVHPVKGTKEALSKMWSEWMPNKLKPIENYIQHEDRFTESGTTIGELGLFASLHLLVLLHDDILDATPKLSAFYKRVLSLPATKKVLNGESKMGTIQQYLVKEE
eukprot:TRINITY_DN11452_c0_g3_i2.p1 TRINITY_DN11452_c0_g3~~TRINITY_DN11452_c0_g3_i2.p1  ORF type:complete len:213 (+),score=50.53 TRINITY_DN11452_c0_g3_i2:46-684(+)